MTDFLFFYHESSIAVGKRKKSNSDSWQRLQKNRMVHADRGIFGLKGDVCVKQ